MVCFMATSLRYFIEAAKYRVILLDFRTKIYSILYIVIVEVFSIYKKFYIWSF